MMLERKASTGSLVVFQARMWDEQVQVWWPRCPDEVPHIYPPLPCWQGCSATCWSTTFVPI